MKNLIVRSRAAIDALNGVIHESIVGAALVRLLNSQRSEREKFLAVNSAALGVSLRVNRLVAGLVPVAALGTDLATLVRLLCALALSGLRATAPRSSASASSWRPCWPTLPTIGGAVGAAGLLVAMLAWLGVEL